MPSNFTENYSLSQWERTDKIQMEDFNADNAKIDAALGTLAAASAKHGNCRIVYGTYTGTGETGSDHANTLTFDGKPLLIIIMPAEIKDTARLRGVLLQGCPLMFATENDYFPANGVTWSGNSVSWYNSSISNGSQLNAKLRYVYVAFLAADE